ncbi:MAG TPA: hypothetical protein PKE16_02085 [Hyphomicrobium sp.]|nr:hypothetical protein [Hyphomicrobium sp.]
MAKISVRRGGGIADEASAANDATVETPSQQIVRAANGTATKVDARGRHITVRKLSSLQKIKLHEMVGPDASKVSYYMEAAFYAASVVKIDSENIVRPVTKLQLEALIDRLDEDGLAASVGALAELLNVRVDSDGNVTRDGEIISTAKK